MKMHLAVGLVFLFCFASVTSAQPSKKSLRAAGRVDAFTQDSITIIAGGDKMTLAVDSATKVIGKGLGTKTQKAKTEGRSPTITDLVNPSDNVVATYVDAGGGKLRATEINVRLAAKQ
jgi:hypothetical protein